MRANLAKSIWLVAIVATTLILVASPSVVVASTEMTVDGCDSSPHHEKVPMPTCCLTGDSPLTHCGLSSASDSQALLPSRFIPNNNVYIALSKTSVSSEASLNPKKPPQRELSQTLPSPPCTEYHCRNCLDSEGPPQV